MKKILALFVISLPFIAGAQLVDISAHGGVALYKMSAGIKNGYTSIFNVEAAYTKLQSVEFGLQLQKVGKVTICDIIAPGVFVDALIHHKEEDKQLFIAGVQVNYNMYGNIKRGGEYGTNGGIDTVTTKAGNGVSYGLRVGYKKRIADHFYGSILVSPTYTTSPIYYTNMPSGKFNLLLVPVMLGITVKL